MTSITYNHVFEDDFTDASSWAETESALDAILSVIDGDVFQILGVTDGAGDEYAYYELNVTNFSTDLYPFFAVRWKTSAESNGLGARVEAVFTAGTQDLLESAGVPQFSTTWQVTTGTLTAGKTVDKIRIYADDYPDAVAGGSTFYVYYDWIMFGNQFTIPYVALDGKAGGIDVDIPVKRVVHEVPERHGDIVDVLGLNNARVTLTGDMDWRTTWKSGSSTVGYAFYDIISNPDTWCWFESTQLKCRVKPVDFKPVQRAGSRKKLLYDLLLEEYTMRESSSESIKERWGIT